MQIQQVLVQLECVENEMAGFYDWLSEVFEADGDASGLFVPKKNTRWRGDRLRVVCVVDDQRYLISTQSPM